MALIPMIDYETASPEVRAAHDGHLKVGKMTNMKRTLLNSVPAFNALMTWYDLRAEAAKFLTDLDINIFCYSISNTNECLICSMFFTKILVDAGIDMATFELDEKQKLLEEFGSALVLDPKAKINEDMIARLRKFFTDEQIVLLDAFGAIMIATNLINSSLKVDLDGYLAGYVSRR
ncbi:MAG: hypothetical protein IJK60_04900 [Clostridia bacterium]|nr:hypothetical protein [Clostridia bacterium]